MTLTTVTEFEERSLKTGAKLNSVSKFPGSTVKYRNVMTTFGNIQVFLLLYNLLKMTHDPCQYHRFV